MKKWRLPDKIHNFSVLAYSKVPKIIWLRIFQINLVFNAIFILCGPLALIGHANSYPTGIKILLITLPLYIIWCGITWPLLIITQRGHSAKTLLYAISSILLFPMSMGIMISFLYFSKI